MLGHPIRQARTPEVFNRRMAEQGVDVVNVPVDLLETGLDAFFAMLRAMENCVGCIITYPYKQRAFAAASTVSVQSAFLEACNILKREADGSLSGSISDGQGYLEALRRNGISPRGKDVLLVGAGGAGAAIAYALAQAGIARLVIVELDAERQRKLADKLSEAFPGLEVLAAPPQDFRYELLCNASPAGMSGDTSMPYPLDRLGPEAIVTDIVPYPAETPWVQAAKARGLRTQTGPEMVDGQLDIIIKTLQG
ncbi:shikimate dehydrogenase [Telmatospirillum sp. J64-1]|uniref:shikimate dehydrogenase family protein n=1 Tax=Telmatospirillum sp. J64-1 TaxID=2502183 RepID=UPI00163DCDFA|nr:shikimate dehydrogenase [Telmatospirillum sp. J64-1]